jgi:mannose/cellobiose epimerase-like protein (N-acyl-D-glucosamine 2-epimerase family)
LKTLDLRSLCADWRERLPLSPAGYAEEVDSSWRETGGPKRTALCQARLAYVFTHAGLLGARCASTGAEAVERLQRLFWSPESKGWRRSLSGEGAAEPVVDTYDQPFGLLALAWHYRATGDERAKATARLAVEGLDESATAVSCREGYPELRAAGDPRNAIAVSYRRQNPHMHLLEAFLAWQAADPSPFWLERAAGIVKLFRGRFLGRETGSLREYFGQDWLPATGSPGRLREPGHHFEWVWLLRRYSLASGDDSVREDAANLYSFALGHGVDDDGLAFDVVNAEGDIEAGTKLLWPQTEMLKAHLAWFEWTADEESRDRAIRTLSSLQERYMIPGTSLWHSQLDRCGKHLSVPTLSRLLYHLFVALAEAERLL